MVTNTPTTRIRTTTTHTTRIRTIKILITIIHTRLIQSLFRLKDPRLGQHQTLRIDLRLTRRQFPRGDHHPNQHRILRRCQHRYRLLGPRLLQLVHQYHILLLGLVNSQLEDQLIIHQRIQHEHPVHLRQIRQLQNPLRNRLKVTNPPKIRQVRKNPLRIQQFRKSLLKTLHYPPNHPNNHLSILNFVQLRKLSVAETSFQLFVVTFKLSVSMSS
mmetsp:Transcript_15847/g.36524  ORF Transcript_15847/g.36524 Transcript_15847/m.36524 type:complete len:215 (+) Transcript_15847:194-838(+)